MSVFLMIDFVNMHQKKLGLKRNSLVIADNTTQIN